MLFTFSLEQLDSVYLCCDYTNTLHPPNFSFESRPSSPGCPSLPGGSSVIAGIVLRVELCDQPGRLRIYTDYMEGVPPGSSQDSAAITKDIASSPKGPSLIADGPVFTPESPSNTWTSSVTPSSSEAAFLEPEFSGFDSCGHTSDNNVAANMLGIMNACCTGSHLNQPEETVDVCGPPPQYTQPESAWNNPILNAWYGSTSKFHASLDNMISSFDLSLDSNAGLLDNSNNTSTVELFTTPAPSPLSSLFLDSRPSSVASSPTSTGSDNWQDSPMMTTFPAKRSVKRIPCKRCKQTFTRRHDLLRHELRQHGKVTEWACHRCRKVFSSSKRLDSHDCCITVTTRNRGFRN